MKLVHVLIGLVVLGSAASDCNRKNKKIKCSEDEFHGCWTSMTLTEKLFDFATIEGECTQIGRGKEDTCHVVDKLAHCWCYNDKGKEEACNSEERLNKALEKALSIEECRTNER
eukprot:139031_1